MDALWVCQWNEANALTFLQETASDRPGPPQPGPRSIPSGQPPPALVPNVGVGPGPGPNPSPNQSLPFRFEWLPDRVLRSVPQAEPPRRIPHQVPRQRPPRVPFPDTLPSRSSNPGPSLPPIVASSSAPAPAQPIASIPAEGMPAGPALQPTLDSVPRFQSRGGPGLRPPSRGPARPFYPGPQPS